MVFELSDASPTYTIFQEVVSSKYVANEAIFESNELLTMTRSSVFN